MVNGWYNWFYCFKMVGIIMEKKIIDYEIIMSNDRNVFEERIKKRLLSGWEFRGNLIVGITNFYQVMIMYEKGE